MIDLRGKTALVTGASRGIGRAIALWLGRAGANVAVTDLLTEDRQQDLESLSEYSLLAGHFQKNGQIYTLSTAEEIRQLGSRSLAVPMDVTDSVQVAEVMEKVRTGIGPVDILVNNAAVMENLARFEDQRNDHWKRDLEVNLTGAFICSKAVWPEMRARGFGRIINISSIAGLMGAASNPAYGASKAGMIGLTKSLALEGGRFGITVNAVVPGFIATETVMLAGEHRLARYKERCAMKKLGRPEDVAAAVAFLASNHAGFITGAVIPVTGGVDLLAI